MQKLEERQVSQAAKAQYRWKTAGFTLFVVACSLLLAVLAVAMMERFIF